MKPELRDWLLACPSLSHVSMLAIDAHRLGLIDLPTAVVPAIAEFVRLSSHGPVRDHGSSYHARHARLGALCRHRPRIRLNGHAALLYGTIYGGAAISQSRRGAILHLTSPIPETLLCAMVGRRLSDVIDAPLFAGTSYVITSATAEWRGCSIQFEVPLIPVDWQHAPHTSDWLARQSDVVG